MTYSWLTLAYARAALSSKLADPGLQQWTGPELTIYIQESLRMWNAYTCTWTGEWVADATAWMNTGSMPGSPRLRTTADTDAYRVMQYHLLEPPTGGTWTGTTQFSIADFSGAWSRCRDEALQVAGCNVGFAYPQAQPGVRRVALPAGMLEPQRVRFIPSGAVPSTLVRDDRLALERFSPGFTQAPEGTPFAWMGSLQPPLSFDVDTAPATPGFYEVLGLLAGAPLSPPASTPVELPDDFAWVARWGALAALLGRDSEATDRARSAWCEQQYQAGLKLLANTPWLLLASLNGQSVDVLSYTEADRYHPEWDSDSSFSSVVVAGVDSLWAPPGYSLGLTLLGNAPLPVADTDFVQVSQSAWGAVLSMAQLLATFKLGGAEFQQAQPLMEAFTGAAIAENKRLGNLGLVRDEADKRATAELRQQERYGSR